MSTNTPTAFATMLLPRDPTVLAPDGSDVRVLLALAGGSMAHFTLEPGQTAQAVEHRSVEEIWYVLEGRGEVWRKQGEREEIVALNPGVCLTLPVATQFQFRATGDAPLCVLGVTLPPWPGADEALPARGPWTASTGA